VQALQTGGLISMKDVEAGGRKVVNLPGNREGPLIRSIFGRRIKRRVDPLAVRVDLSNEKVKINPWAGPMFRTKQEVDAFVYDPKRVAAVSKRLGWGDKPSQEILIKFQTLQKRAIELIPIAVLK